MQTSTKDREFTNALVSADIVEFFAEKARAIRRLTISAAYDAGPDRKAHIGGAFSMADILSVLYFGVMNVYPDNPHDPGRDRLVLSKGHGCVSLYAALAERGFFDPAELKTVRRLKSILQGHPDMKKTPGIDMTTGSLGNGFGLAVGMAIAAKIEERSNNVYCIIGDGEQNEGVIWEAAQVAVKYELDNLIGIADMNGYQSCGSVESVMPGGDIAEKWRAFGWNTVEIDGHDFPQIIGAFNVVRTACASVPTMIIARTLKGKGVSFMEGTNEWHQKAPSEDEKNRALKELGGQS